ncbi:MAG: Ig-like domain-containing protein, partial [Clostridia bacterium]|nr:Ig-like domain-containing protein [Clostridia bacterium]
YYASESKWLDTSKSKDIKFKTDGLEEGTVITATFRAAPEYYMRSGDIDWDSLSEGTRITQQFTVDGIDPEILSVDTHYDAEKDAIDAVRIKAKDNRYIAVAVLADEDEKIIDFSGSDPDVNAEAGKELEYVFDLTKSFDDLSKVPEHLLVSVCDYAVNEANYYLNLNTDELSEEQKVVLDKGSITIAVNQSEKIGAKVTPWGKYSDVVWSSNDESIATVNDRGVITAVSAGNTVIKASLADDPDIYSEVNVTCVIIEKTFNAVIWDEEARKWFASFDTDKLPEYQKLSEEPISVRLASMCYDLDGTLYGTTFSSNSDSSDLYKIDDKTFEMTLVGTSDAGCVDLAPAPAISELSGSRSLISVFGTYVIWLDSSTAEVVSGFNYTEETAAKKIVGIAYHSSFVSEQYGTASDEYYAVDETGCLYRAAYTFANDEFKELYFESLGNIGDPVDVWYYQSLYFDTEGDLIWSRTHNGDDYTNIIICDVTDKDNVTSISIGKFPKNVWPVGGIYENGKGVVFDYEEMIAASGAGKDGAGKELQVNNNAYDQLSVGFDSLVINIKASEEMTNGLYTVSFDPAVYKPAEFKTPTEYYSVNVKDGNAYIALVAPGKFAEGDVAATLSLQVIGEGSKVITVKTDELNEKIPGTIEYLFISDDQQYVELLKPIITVQPADWAGEYGEYPSISVTAVGPELTYKWYYRDAGKTEWMLSSDNDSCYDSYPLTAGRNGREVYCEITSKYGYTVASETAVMKLYVPEGYTGPVITSQPQSWAGNWNEFPDITVIAEGPELTYKWYYRDAGQTKWKVSSDNDNCYDSYPLDETRNGREVYCLITDRYGFTVKSNVVTMGRYIYGDANGDNVSDSFDATIILRFDAGLVELSDDARIACDVNGDGETDAADASLILSFDCGLIDAFPLRG